MVETDWIVGYHAVLGALESPRAVETVWLQQGRRDQRLHQLEQKAGVRGVATRWVPRWRLDDLAGDRPHNGCAARCGPVPLALLEELIMPAESPARLLLLDGVTDPYNLGAAIRTAVAFSVDGVIIAGPSAPPLGGTVARAAVGLLDSIPLVRTTVAGDALVRLRDAGYWALGADAGGEVLDQARPIARWVLCVGAEDRGLRAKTRSKIDEFVRIPMAEGVDSLNVSVATGVLLYHLCCLWE
jgi:23S rRNA (guanosine2251-2'-O)-methyltransferase